MDTYRAIGLTEGWIETEDMNEVIKAWQHLHDTGVAYKLQGWFARTAEGLVAEGFIRK